MSAEQVKVEIAAPAGAVRTDAASVAADKKKKKKKSKGTGGAKRTVSAKTHEAAKKRRKDPGAKKPQTIGKRSGLVLPVARVRTLLSKDYGVSRMEKNVPIYLTAVLQYMNSEVYDGACEITEKKQANVVTPKYMATAINADPELRKVFDVCIVNGGYQVVRPVIKKKKKKKSAAVMLISSGASGALSD
jgi:hypothetical protein